MPHAKIDHPYLVKKDVQPFPEVMQDKKGRLVIPLMDENHKIHSLQRISPNGFKCLKKGARKTGHFFVVGYKPLKNGEPILYAEGYATAASIAEATNRSVVMTVDAGNTPKVAEKLKACYPESQHLFLADDDRKNSVNKGIEKAKEAANLTNGYWLAPRFIQDQIEVGMTDFNDLAMSSGLSLVRQQIEDHIEHCWPHLSGKTRTPEYNSITPDTNKSAIPSDTGKAKPANQQLDEQFKPLTKLAHSRSNEAIKDAKPVTPKPQPQIKPLPERISKLYLEVDNKYYFSSRPKCIAFIDKGNKLQTKLSHAQVIGDLLSIAKQRDWQSIKLSGCKAFKRQAWLQASMQNMNVRGYRPDKEDVKQLNTLQAKSYSPQVKQQPTAQKAEPFNEIEPVKPKQAIDKQSALKAAQEFCQSLQPEAQKQFMEKVIHKLENFFLKPQNTENSSNQIIKEPQHDRQLEH